MSKAIERRLVSSSFEIRREGAAVSLSGYAAMFDSPAHGEVVRSSAFSRTLAQRDNVRLLVNHDGVPLASTKAGTMTLSTDSVGLRMHVPSLDMSNPTAQELVSAIERGDIDQMSFAFEQVGPDAHASDGTRELREVKLYDVSVVTFPWYESTSVGIDRSLDQALVSLRNRTPLSSEERDVIVLALGGSSVVLGDIDDDGDATTTPGDMTPDPMDAGEAEPDADEVDLDAVCPSCGAPVDSSWTFCPVCGNQLPNEATNEALGAGPAPVPTPTISQYAGPQLFELASVLAARTEADDRLTRSGSPGAHGATTDRQQPLGPEATSPSNRSHKENSMTLSDRVAAERDAVLAHARSVVAAAEAAGATMTPEQFAEVRAARAKADDLATQIEDLKAIAAREAAAAPVAALNGGARVKAEERTYTRRADVRGERSFFADAYRSQQGDFDARARIERHMNEARVEGEVQARAVTSTALAGLVVPQYLVDLAAIAARNGRPVANAITRLQLPDQGMSLIVPRGTTGTVRLAHTSSVEETAVFSVACEAAEAPVVTIAGQQDVSRQSVERGIPGLDALIYRDLAGAYAAELDRQVVAGTGASNQMLGFQNTAGINQATAFTAAATATTFWSKISGAINAVEASGTVVAPANLIIMHPRRWSWIMQQVDTQGRPLATPVANGLQVFNAFGVDAVPGAYSGNPQAASTAVDFTGFTIKGYLQGLPVITDANTPTAVGTGPEDLVWVINTAHALLWENGDGMPNQLRFEQTLGNQLTVKLVAYNYAAFTAGRYPTAISQVGGNAGTAGFGLIAPTF